MTSKYLVTLLATTASLLLFLAAPGAGLAAATDLLVTHNPNPNDPNQFASIQAAITHADTILKGPAGNQNSFRILVQPDPVPYAGPVTAISNVPILGKETGRTFIGASNGTFITIGSGVTNVAIRNLTFLTGTTGISISDAGTGISITNNVFNLGSKGTAVIVRRSPNTQIDNNTFYVNLTGIDTSNGENEITNDIFSTNTNSIVSSANLTATTYNLFFNNTFKIPQEAEPNSVSTTANNTVNPNPLFVDPGNHDFHLQEGSPAHSYAGKNAGNPTLPNRGAIDSFDMGAYGGPFRDTIPMPVRDLTTKAVTTSSVALTWSVNKSYEVRGYNVYFGPSPVFPGTDFGNSVKFVQQIGSDTTTGTNLDGFAPASVPPEPTTITSISPVNHGLSVTWRFSANATGYRVHFTSDPTLPMEQAPSLPVTGGTTTSAVIRGLQNGVTYRVAVAAVNQTTVFVSVTSVNTHSAPTTPGVDNESVFSSPLEFNFGEPIVSALSPEVKDFPEATSAYPNLKSGGCFIATAAYGFYSAPQVQALRIFRDRYLMTSAPGRAFVAWYYRHGPRAAQYLNAHPWLKPGVRLALFPLVALSVFLICTPPLLKLGMLLAALVCAGVYQRKRNMPLLAGRVR